MHRVNARLGDQAGVLQITLAPAAVALQLGQQIRRLLLVAAHQVGHQPDGKTGAAHQRGLNKIMRHDAARHAASALDVGQCAMLHERLDADDRVVAPVVRLAHLPELHAQCEQAASNARRKLLRACVQSDVADGLGGGLDDAGLRVGLHQLDHRDQAVAAHHAVGVEHHHIAVILAPAAAKVGHIAGLAVGAAFAQAVVHLDLRLVGLQRQLAAQVFPGGAFGLLYRQVAGVRQHKHIKSPDVTGGGYGFAGGTQAGKYGAHVFVADRHDDRGARRVAERVALHLTGRKAVRVAAQRHVKTHHGGHETRHHPGRQQRKQCCLAVLQPLAGVVGLNVDEQAGRKHRADQRQHQECRAALAGGTLPRLQRAALLTRLVKLRNIFLPGQWPQHGGCQAVPEAAPRTRRH